MRSSKSRHDRVGMALAGMLGLTGIVLLLVARPIATPVFHRSGGEGVFEAEDPAPAAAPDALDAPLPPTTKRHIPPAPPWTRPGRARQPASPFSPPPTPQPVEPASNPAEVAPTSADPSALATILRASGLACLGGREALLSPAERELCREKLGTQAWRDASLPAIDPEARAGYDAVARAQAPRRALVPLTARGAGGSFAQDDRQRAGRRPRVGCALRFGPNADQASDSQGGGLRAGPCFLQAPAAPSASDGKPY